MREQTTNTSELEASLQHARAVRFEGEEAELAVRTLLRTADVRLARTGSPRLVWMSACAVALSLFGAFFFGGRMKASSPSIGGPAVHDTRVIRVGSRVALKTDLDADYVIMLSNEHETRLGVSKGNIRLRRFKGEAIHHLRVQAADLEIEALGTIFEVGVEGARGHVRVFEGQVEARRGDEQFLVSAGQSYRDGRVIDERTLSPDAETLAALEAPTQLKGLDERVDRQLQLFEEEVEEVSSRREVARSEPKPLDAKETWRKARLHRGQGDYAEAEKLLIKLTAEAHTRWSPLASIELARLYLDALLKPEDAARVSQAFLETHPTHTLVPEVRELLCRANRQLGSACARGEPE